MIQFKPYPIYVVYSKQNQEDAALTVQEYNKKGDYEWEKMANNAALTTEDSDPAYRKEVQDYETNMITLLKKIQAIPIGKTLLQLFKHDVWIVPKRSGSCYCAITYPLDYETKSLNYSEGKGDTYIWFDPSDDFKDDTLFHELVHAYRYSTNKFHRRAVGNNEYNTEEFLAHQMQNIYRSIKRLWLLYTYNDGTVADHPGKWGTKDEIYRHFTSNPEFPMVLKHFFNNDPYARIIAQLPYPEYNPFRDWRALERRYLATIAGSGIKSLPAF